MIRPNKKPNKSQFCEQQGISQATFAGWMSVHEELKKLPRGQRKNHKGQPVENSALEQQVLDWIVAVRSGPSPIALSRRTIILKALQLDKRFKNAKLKRLQSWVSKFLKRNSHILSIRAITSTSAKIAHRLESNDVRSSAINKWKKERIQL